MWITGEQGVDVGVSITLDDRAEIGYEADWAAENASLLVNDGRTLHLQMSRDVLHRCLDALNASRKDLDRETDPDPE